MRFRLTAADESVLDEGEATCAVTAGALVVTPEQGQPLRVRPADVLAVRDVGPGALDLPLDGGAALRLDRLGRLHGQVLADLVQAREDDLVETLLLAGVGRPETFPGAVGPGAVEARIRLYDDVLVVLPVEGPPEQVPFAVVTDVATDATGYGVEIRTLDERTVRLTRLARRSGEFVDLLRARVAAARGRTGYLVGAVLPGLDAVTARTLAAALPDGVATPRTPLDAVDPSAFDALVAACALPERLGCVAVLAGLGELSFGWHQRRSVERAGWSTSRGTSPAAPGPRDHGGRAPAPGGLAGVLQGSLVERLGDPSGGLSGGPAAGLDDVLAVGVLGGAFGGGLPPGQAWHGPGAGGLGHDRTPTPRAQPRTGQGAPARTDLAALGEPGAILAFVLCTTPGGHVLFEALNEADHPTYAFGPALGPAAVARGLALLGFRTEALTSPSVPRAVERLPHLRSLREALTGQADHDDGWEAAVRDLATP